MTGALEGSQKTSSPLRGKIEMGVKGSEQEGSGNRNSYNTLGG